MTNLIKHHIKHLLVKVNNNKIIYFQDHENHISYI